MTRIKHARASEDAAANLNLNDEFRMTNGIGGRRGEDATGFADHALRLVCDTAAAHCGDGPVRAALVTRPGLGAFVSGDFRPFPTRFNVVQRFRRKIKIKKYAANHPADSGRFRRFPVLSGCFRPFEKKL